MNSWVSNFLKTVLSIALAAVLLWQWLGARKAAASGT